MTVKNENVTQEANVADDISSISVVSEPDVPEVDVDANKLNALKAKLAAKQGTQMPPKIVEKKTRSIKVGVVGSGQAGSRLAEAFYNIGYDAVVFNTAPQDLEPVKLPEGNKYLLQHGLGGAAKETELGKQAAELHRDAINELVSDKLGNCQVFFLCL